MKLVNSKTLGDAVEFDHVFTLTPDVDYNDNLVSASGVRATYRDAMDYAPGYALAGVPEVKQDAVVDEYGDVHVDGDAWISQPDKMFTQVRWSFFSRGYTAQAFTKKSDPCMYYGVETLGGRLAQDMIEEGGTFAMVRVQLDTDTEEEHESESWVILRMDD